MKKIELQRTEIEKIKEDGSHKRFSPKLFLNKLKKEYQKRQTKGQEEMQARKKAFVGFFVSKYKTLAAYPPITKYFIVVYILLLFGLYFFFSFTTSALGNLFDLEGKVVAAEENIGILEDNIALLEDSEAIAEKIQKDIYKIDSMAPEKPREEDIVVLLGTLLSQNQLTSPERFTWTEEKETSIETADIYNYYNVYSYNFMTTGPLQNIYAFLSDLRKSVRLIDVKDIKMVPLANGDIELTLLIWTYNKIKN